MNIHEFVSLLGDALGEPPQWENDSLTIFVDDVEIVIEYIPSSDYLYLYSPMAQASEAELERLASGILSANLFAAETGGAAAIAYEATAGRVALWQKLRLSSTPPDQFREEFMVFQGAARHWRAWFRDGGEAEGDGANDGGGRPFAPPPQLA